MYSCFIIVMTGMSVIGFLKYRDFLNPITLYNLIWELIVCLYNLQLSPLQKDLSNTTYIYILLSGAFFTISCIISSFIRPRNSKSRDTISKIEIDQLFILWLIISVIEIVYSGGVPILWSIIGNGKTYFDFGIPSVHGFANAFGLSLVSIMFYKYLNKRDNKMLLRIFIMIIFYIFLLTRQVIISMVIQIFIIYCFYAKRVPWKKFFIGGIIGVLLFGILGNIRTGYTSFLSVAMIESDIHPIFIGVYWVYMYLTMTVANLNKVFSLVFIPIGSIHIAATYLPSIIREAIFFNHSYSLPDYLVTQAFNVSGYFMDFYLSYGVIGIIVIASIYGLLGGTTYKKIKCKRSEKNIIYYSVYVQIILLSFFYNHLLYLPSGFQFVIVWLLFKPYKIILGNKKLA